MEQDTLKRIAKLETQMIAMIDHHNTQEDRLEKMSFDVKSIFVGIREFQKACAERHRNDESE